MALKNVLFVEQLQTRADGHRIATVLVDLDGETWASKGKAHSDMVATTGPFQLCPPSWQCKGMRVKLALNAILRDPSRTVTRRLSAAQAAMAAAQAAIARGDLAAAKAALTAAGIAPDGGPATPPAPAPAPIVKAPEPTAIPTAPKPPAPQPQAVKPSPKPADQTGPRGVVPAPKSRRIPV